MKRASDAGTWPIVAICYDFDKTLSPEDMQNYSLLPKLQCPTRDFWNASNSFAKENGMDKILAYMLHIIKKAKDVNVRIAKEDFQAMGREIKLFKGVDTWFARINQIAQALQVRVEHYIISAGLKEILEGTPIAPYFTEIYASSFSYDIYGAPNWPCQVVNYTSKTQYLFRINKNCLELDDEEGVNEYVPDEDRRIPFHNFIYIGDSETDIPAMKIVKNGGGVSIGVYNEERGSLDRVRKLLEQDRIDYLLPANYTAKSRLEKVVAGVLERVSANENLREFSKAQNDYIRNLEDIESLVPYTKRFVDNTEIDKTT